MNFYDYFTIQSKKKDITNITGQAPNEALKQCKYAVDELDVDPSLIFLDLEIYNMKHDYSEIMNNLIYLVKQKRAQTESMVNILSKDINDYDNLIEKFKNDKDVDTTGYMGFLEKHRNESKGEHDYLSLLLNKQIEWLADNE